MKLNSKKSVQDQPPQNTDAPHKLARFFQQFNTLDMSSYGSWPIAVKLSCYVFSFLLVCLISYFAVIQPQLQAIDAAVSQQEQLLNEYKEKSSKLRNLKQYQLSLLQMEKTFNQQLEQLPKESEIPSLLEDIHRAALRSGLKIVNIQLENEQKQAFFIEQPITIEARGDYHAYGQFVSYLAELPRIVTLHDFIMQTESDPNAKTDVPVVAFTLKAKTYRYISPTAQSKGDAGSPLQALTPAEPTEVPVSPAAPNSNANPDASNNSQQTAPVEDIRRPAPQAESATTQDDQPLARGFKPMSVQMSMLVQVQVPMSMLVQTQAQAPESVDFALNGVILAAKEA